MPRGHAPFALFNRTGNPAIKLVLESPLHRLLSRQLAVITVTGRRTGRQHSFPVGYRQNGDRVTIEVGWPERKHWWRNLRDGGEVRLRLRGVERTGHGRVRGDERTSVTVEVQLDPG